jgi:hypothetical protein
MINEDDGIQQSVKHHDQPIPREVSPDIEGRPL